MKKHAFSTFIHDRSRLLITVLTVLTFFAATFFLEVFAPLYSAGSTYARLLMSFYLSVLLASLLIYFFYTQPDLSGTHFLFFGVMSFLALFLRAVCIPNYTADYIDFIKPWIDFFSANGGILGLKESIGDYNVPYLYILSLLSYLHISDLYLVKLISILFDILCAVYAMKIAGVFIRSRAAQTAVFCLVLFFPTVWLNSAYWGQCDSIYVFFILAALFHVLCKRPVLSVLFVAVAFSFKLQTIFILPVFAVLLMEKKVKWRHLLVFPAAYFALVLPAVIIGRPIMDILTIYTSQAGAYADYVNLNAPNLFALIPSAPADIFMYVGMALSGAFILAVLFILYENKSKINDQVIIVSSLLFAIGVPYFLSSMHERYFFIADVLSIIYAFVRPRRWYVPLMVLTASYSGYHAYLFGYYIVDLKAASVILLSAGVIVLLDLLSCLGGPDRTISNAGNMDTNG